MKFEWDAGKTKSNLEKHGVTFDEASTVFNDELSLTVADPDHSISEERSLIFGESAGTKFLVVSFNERGDIIRIISARLMTPRERRAYEL